MPNAPMGARQRESVFSMKGARIVVLGIALAAGGTAAYLVRGDDLRLLRRPQWSRSTRMTSWLQALTSESVNRPDRYCRVE